MADEVATSYTYNGTTVVFSQADQNLLNSDFAKIGAEASKLEGLLNEKANWVAEYNYNNDRLYKISGNCVGLSGKKDHGNPSPWEKCSSEAENRRDFAGSKIGALTDQINTSYGLLCLNPSGGNLPTDQCNKASYVAIYNNNLLKIQNKIKLQIQAQQANSATAAANTQNQVTTNQNSPSAIAQANALSAQLQQQIIEADKQKALKNKQYLFFGIVVLAVIVAGVLVVRKLS